MSTPAGKPGRGRARTRTTEILIERAPTVPETQQQQQQQTSVVAASKASDSPPTPPSAMPKTQEGLGRGRGRGEVETKVKAAKAQVDLSSPSEEGDSPPKQTYTAGRAATRGKQITVMSGTTSGLVGDLAQMELREKAEKTKREYKAEMLPRLRMPGMDRKQDLMGTAGIKVKVVANYFMIDQKINTLLQHYHVDFDPPVDQRSVRIALVSVHKNLFPNNKAFDGMNLYSVDRLQGDSVQVQSIRQHDNATITITIRHVGEISEHSPQFQQLLNILFRKCLGKLGLAEIQRNHYDLKGGRTFDKYNIKILDGFATAIGLYEYQPQISKLLLNADVSYRILNNKNVYDIMSDLYEKTNRDKERFRQEVTQAIVGSVVMTPYNYKTHRIDDIDWTGRPTDTFETRGDSKVSFVDYYRQQYSLNITDVYQALLISRPSIQARRRGDTRPIKLIPEFCLVTGLSDQMRSDAVMMRDVARETASTPQARLETCVSLVNRVNTNQETQKLLNEWQVRFNQKPVEVEARRLEPEVLKFGNDVNKRLTEKADWNNELKSQRHLSAVPIDNWIIVYSARDRDASNQFIDSLFRVVNSMGMRVQEPAMVELTNDRNDTYINSLKQNVNSKTQMVVCLMSRPRKDLYDAIKRFLCIDMPVPSQCILTKNIIDSKKLMGVMTKVAVQINCKLGGEIWSISIPLPKVMICGIDTYHDTQNKNKSVCAFVATINQMKTRFYSRATLQSSHQELGDNLCISFKSALEQYNRVNQAYPDKIIIYRDGVSDGDLQTVKFQEINQIIETIKLVQEGYAPKLAFVVVKKRGNARFFEQKQPGKYENPGCGTVIDNTVTRPDWYDFYLIPQHSSQGTVNPTHFNVIYDTTGLKPDHFQKLSYKLTHMYYNWPGTIRVPAVCQYAHKLAFLVGQSLHKEHHITLADKLYYL